MIGTDITGTQDFGNGGVGILIFNGATGNLIGGNVPGAGNLVSGNDSSGIQLGNGTPGGAASNNIIQCNLVGTDINGTSALANGNTGIVLYEAPNNTIDGNLVSGNTGDGIYITASADNNVLTANRVGTNLAGTGPVPNSGAGIYVTGVAGTRIGTDGDGTEDDAEGNLVSGNTDDGIVLDGAGVTGTTIAGNRIGTNLAGTGAVANGASGIRFWNGAGDARIGTNGDGVSDALEENIISGNAGSGIYVVGGQNVSVAGNHIGVDALGTSALGNTGDGILLQGASNNHIGTNADGTADAAERNVISANLATGGVVITSGGTGNAIAGNYIGTDANGTADLGNAGYGISLSGGAHDNTIGGTTAAARNVISANGIDGVQIIGDPAVQNTIQGNFIGLDASGTVALGNDGYGVHLQDASAAIGGDQPGQGNVISGNTGDGVFVSGVGNGLPDGIVSWYRAEADASDSVGSNDGTLQNGATYTSGQYGQGFSLDGVDDYVEIPSAPEFNSDSLTVEAWVNPDDLSAGHVIASKYDTEDLGQGISWVLQVGAGGGVTFNVYQTDSHGPGTIYTGAVTDAPALSTGTWQHVAATFDLATNATRIYVNGVEVASSLTPGSNPVSSIYDSNTPVRIGTIRTVTAGGLTSFFDGAIDEFAFYDRVLNAREIADLYAAGGVAKGGSVIQGNIIGLDSTGSAAVGNSGNGVRIVDSPLNIIGGNTAGARNIISANGGAGNQYQRYAFRRHGHPRQLHRYGHYRHAGPRQYRRRHSHRGGGSPEYDRRRRSGQCGQRK